MSTCSLLSYRLDEPPKLARLFVGHCPCKCSKFGKCDRGAWVVGSIFLRNQPRRFLLSVFHPEAGASHRDKNIGALDFYPHQVRVVMRSSPASGIRPLIIAGSEFIELELPSGVAKVPLSTV